MTVYSIWDQSAESAALTSFNGTLATEFNLSSSATLTGIWVYSPSGCTALPAACAIYDMDTSTLVSGTLNSSPSWSGAAGSGWVKCTYSTPVLSSGVNYAAAIYYDSSDPPAAYTGGYTWPTASGIIDATAAYYIVGQGAISLPTLNAGAYTYWVDVEVTTGGGTAHTATAALTVTPSFSAGRQRGKYRTGALTVTPSFSAARTRGKYRTGSLLVTPSFSAARLHGHGRAARLIVVPSFSAARSAGHVRTASLLVTPQFRVLWTGGAAPAVQQGSWWGLDAVLKESREEFQEYVSRPPMACPVCGEPLVNAPATKSGSGVELYCEYAGDHQFHYPGDWVPPSRPWY